MNQGQETRPNGVLQKENESEGWKSFLKFFWLYFYVFSGSNSAKGSHSTQQWVVREQRSKRRLK